MDTLFSYYKAHSVAFFLVALLLPIALVLLYGSGKSFWLSRRNKKERTAIYDFMVKSNTPEKAFTNEEITKATGIPKDRVIGHCTDHNFIEDAGKRQRSWKLIKDDLGEE